MPRSKSSPNNTSHVSSWRSQFGPLSVIVLSLLGLIDATLLTIKHYRDINLPCTVTHGCEAVLHSKYAMIGAVPVALFGVVFYFVFLVLGFYLWQRLLPAWVAAVWAGLGVVSSLYLLMIQGLVLHAWCQYCDLSALISGLLFIITVIMITVNTKELPDGQKA